MASRNATTQAKSDVTICRAPPTKALERAVPPRPSEETHRPPPNSDLKTPSSTDAYGRPPPRVNLGAAFPSGLRAPAEDIPSRIYPAKWCSKTPPQGLLSYGPQSLGYWVGQTGVPHGCLFSPGREFKCESDFITVENLSFINILVVTFESYNKYI